MIVYPALQARSQRCDLGIFKKGIGRVTVGTTPDRLDFSNGYPRDLSGIGTTHFFGFYGDKLACVAEGAADGRVAVFFRNLFQAKTAAIGFTLAQTSHTPSSGAR